MALIAVACITAGAAINVATDGGGPPRIGTRAETPPYAAPLVPAAPSSLAPSLSTLRLPKASPARIEDLERELSTAQPSELLPDLVAQDPEAAARFAEMHTEPGIRQLALRQVALLWGAVDAERALNWARSLPDAAERDATFIDIANGLSSVDPARGVELREQFVAATKPDSALNNLVQQWASHDFEDALAWTNARAPGAQRDDLLQRLIYVRAAAGEPAAAALLVTESSLSGEARAAAIASVAQEWASRDGDAAQEWRRTLEPATLN
jgi:hypothetical protein